MCKPREAPAYLWDRRQARARSTPGRIGQRLHLDPRGPRQSATALQACQQKTAPKQQQGQQVLLVLLKNGFCLSIVCQLSG